MVEERGVLKFAESLNWLENRPNLDTFLKDPKNWDKINDSLREHIVKLGLTTSESIYLKRFCDEHKDDFSKYILQLDNDSKKDALKNFEPIISEIEAWFYPST